jgi:hypothetical protein
MTFANFKIFVAAYLNRDPASLIIGGVDILKEAINDAKRAGQREFDFPQLNKRAFIQGWYYGTPITNAVDNPDSLTPTTVVVNHIYAAWRYASLLRSDGITDYIRTQKYEFMSEKSMRDIIPARNDALKEPNILPITYKQRAYVRGTDFFLTGVTDKVWVWIDVIAMLPDYSADADTDFFLTDYRDWMLIKTLECLNFYLKDDDRVQISNAQMNLKWNSVLAHANRIADGHDQANSLD